ncbi:hypothetical protein D3C85_1697610 [compost metagenome]
MHAGGEVVLAAYCETDKVILCRMAIAAQGSAIPFAGKWRIVPAWLLGGNGRGRHAQCQDQGFLGSIRSHLFP